MILKVLAGLAALGAAGLYFGDALSKDIMAFDGGEYEKRVERPVAEVAATLAGLDLDEFSEAGPGAHQAMPQIRRRTDPAGFTWFVMSGHEVAAELAVTLTPAEGGVATEVRGRVVGGTLTTPDPRGYGRLMQYLFSNALDGQLAALAPPEQRLPDKELQEKRRKATEMMTMARIVADPLAPATMGMDAMEEHRKYERELEESRRVAELHRGVSFEAGKPMVDVRR